MAIVIQDRTFPPFAMLSVYALEFFVQYGHVGIWDIMPYTQRKDKWGSYEPHFHGEE